MVSASMLATSALLLSAAALIACGGTVAESPQSRLERIVLQPVDAGEGYARVEARAITNEEAARARPDTAQAREQYDAWGQLLRYTVQLAPPPEAVALFSPEIARIINSATLFEDEQGATASFAWTRQLSTELLADVVVSEGAGTQITDTQATRMEDVPVLGDESFALRISGKATFEDGLTTAFVADTVFVRIDRATGSVTAVALGQAPRREEVLALVDRFVERARGEQE